MITSDNNMKNNEKNMYTIYGKLKQEKKMHPKNKSLKGIRTRATMELGGINSVNVDNHSTIRRLT